MEVLETFNERKVLIVSCRCNAVVESHKNSWHTLRLLKEAQKLTIYRPHGTAVNRRASKIVVTELNEVAERRWYQIEYRMVMIDVQLTNIVNCVRSNCHLEMECAIVSCTPMNKFRDAMWQSLGNKLTENHVLLKKAF